ncbi:unnamed protein product [Moneuplotes crassus]|uniref:Uncharacterized protein n=1 Tax=Euplotes crassus TaxID=5936 RepID=A0AAD1Y4W2_EUPCR|nr:unnamed protein product [Moneuplotes crassus]
MSVVQRNKSIKKYNVQKVTKNATPRSCSVPGSGISTPKISQLTQKDRENICEIVLQNGIDPRSLAFEIVTKRVCDLFLSKKKSKGSPRNNKLFIENAVKDTLDKDITLKTTLNKIFKSSTSPCEVDIQNLTAEILQQQLQKTQSTDRTQSQNRYSGRHSVIEPKFGNLTENKTSCRKTQPGDHESSEEKPLEKASLMQESERVSEVSIVFKEKKLEKSDSAQEIPLDPPPKPMSPTKIYYEIDHTSDIDKKGSFSVTPTQDPDQDAKPAEVSKKAEPPTPEKNSGRRSTGKFNDDISCFEISPPPKEEAIEQEKVQNDTVPQNLAEVDILQKEYELGRELLHKAGDKITSDNYRELARIQSLNEYDYKILQIMFSLLFSIRNKSDCIINSLDRIDHMLNDCGEVLLLQSDFDLMIEKNHFSSKSTVQFRDEFVKVSPYNSANPTISCIKEYLCEAFCLIDIIEEIKGFEAKIAENVPKISKDSPKVANFGQREHRKSNEYIESMKDPQNTSRTSDKNTITARYYKKMEEQNQDFSYDMPRKRNVSRTPKINKVNRTQSRILKTSTPKLVRDSKGVKRNGIKKKTPNKSSFISKSPKPSILGKSPKVEKGSKSLKPADMAKEYALKHERKVVKKTTRGAQYDANGHRIYKSKNQVPNKPISSYKKPTTPMKVSNRTIERRLESHLPSNFKNSQQTKRKAVRKSFKKKKSSIQESVLSDQNRTSIQSYNQSPRRKPVSPLRSPKRKSPRRETGRMSPTKRMIDMKNSYIKNQRKAQKDPQNAGKLIYTISPDEGYIVDQDFKELTKEELEEVSKSITRKSAEFCGGADQERSNQYGDLMVKNHLKKRVQ